MRFQAVEVRLRRGVVGALLVLLVTGFFVLPPVQAADVKAFGAVGDGQADDTPAVQRALTAGGSVHFPAGVFRLTQTVTIDLDRTGFVALVGDGTARIVMAGAGPAFKFVGTHAGSADPEQFKPNVWARQRTPRVDGLEIVGEHPEADGIEASGTMQLTVTHAVLRELRHGIHLTVRNRNVLIADTHIYRLRGVGIYYDQVNLHQSNITGCHISYCAGGGIVSRGGNVRNVHIGNCDIESNMTKGTPATANILLDSSGGSIGEVAITGCTIQHNSVGPHSANIRILGRGHEPALERRTGSAATQEGHVTITGNVLSDVQVNIHLRDVRGVTITGNTFWMGYQHDLLVEDSSSVVVGANNFDRNPRYNYGSSQDANGGIVFRGTRDSTITGVHLSGAWRKSAALLLEKCERLHLAQCTILDSDGVGIWLQDTGGTRVSGNMVRDDRKDRTAAPSLRVTGGRGNWITQNLLGQGAEIAAGTATAEGNHTVTDSLPR
ncbi:right-handed parallel beta-helix repeat-containing protein [Horticoccus sp. 23ND18S-11]|uniref:right-handed parallel beta-helix repeat-containing protein n=1 Tax=Horticoccus sp. 23ND18S-11 TaxID=3391832 RepID=UPI0039C9ADC0